MKPAIFTAHTITAAMEQLATTFDALRTAHEALDWPENEDQVVDWRAIVQRIDTLGQAGAHMRQLLRDDLLVPLKTLRTLAQEQRGQVDTLNQLAEALPRA